jgi:hypothetical protein
MSAEFYRGIADATRFDSCEVTSEAVIVFEFGEKITIGRATADYVKGLAAGGCFVCQR